MVPWDYPHEPDNVLKEMSVKSIEDEELDEILNLLSSKEENIVTLSIYALGSIGDRRTAKAVFTTAKERGVYDDEVGGEGVIEIADFVGFIIKTDAVEEFVEFFKHDFDFLTMIIWGLEIECRFKVVEKIIEALKEEPDYLLDVLNELACTYESPEILKRAKKDIFNFKESLIEENLKLEFEYILKYLEGTKNEKDEREFSELIKKKIEKFQESKINNKKQILEELYSYLQSDNNYEIYYALWRLEELKLSESIDKILPLLEHWDRYIRRDAIEILGKIGDKRAKEPLRNLLEKETSSITRGRIMEALDKLKD